MTTPDAPEVAAEPCRICGGEAVISQYHGIAVNGWVVECANDMETGAGYHSTGRQDTLSAATEQFGGNA